MIEHCKTCKHWTPYLKKYPRALLVKADEGAGGFCGSNKLTENWDDMHDPDMLVYPYFEDAEFWTGPDFGCVHHTKVQQTQGQDQ